MSVKLIKSSEGALREISKSHSVLNLLTINDCESLSVGVSVAEYYIETMETPSNRAYYVLEGELVIDDISAKPGDVAFVPINTKYTLKGKFKAIVINSPAFGKK